MRTWQLQAAKARLSELVKTVANEGPQEISVRGESAAVVISKADYERLRRPKASFVEFLLGSPLAGLDLNVERHGSAVRDVRL